MVLDSLLAGIMLFSSFAARTPNVQPNPDDYEISIGVSHNNFYANRDLIMNSIHFLAGNKDRLAIRNKSIKFSVLDVKKIKDNTVFWKWFIFLGSIFIVFIVSLINQVMRSKHLLK